MAALENERLNIDQQRIVTCSLGTISQIRLRSVWDNNKYVQDDAPESRLFSKINFRPENCEVRRTGDLIDPARLTHQVVTKGIPETKCLVVKFDNFDADYFGFAELVVPMTEILRFYYGTSSSLLQAIFSGKKASESIYRPEFNSILSDGTHVVNLRTRIPDTDAPLAARIAFSEVAERKANDIYEKTVADALRREMVNGSYIKNQALPVIVDAWPPFEGYTDLYARVYKHHGRLWVHSIISCSHKFPFDKLLFGRANDGRTDHVYDPDRPPIYVGGYPVGVPNDVDNVPIDDSEEPSLDIQTTDITHESNEQRFPGLENTQVSKIEKLIVQYRNGRHVKIDNVDIEGLSTALGNYSSSNIKTGKVTISSVEPEKDKKPKSEQFAFIRKAVEHLLNDPGNEVSCSYRRIQGWETGSKYEGTSYFPSVGKVKGNNWIYIHKGKKKSEDRLQENSLLRRVLVIEITRFQKKHYLIEIERKKSDESIATLYFKSLNCEKLTNFQLICELERYATNRSEWASSSSYLKRSRMHHRRNESPQEFSKRLLKKMSSQEKSSNI